MSSNRHRGLWRKDINVHMLIQLYTPLTYTIRWSQHEKRNRLYHTADGLRKGSGTGFQDGGVGGATKSNANTLRRMSSAEPFVVADAFKAGKLLIVAIELSISSLFVLCMLRRACIRVSAHELLHCNEMMMNELLRGRMYMNVESNV